MPQSDSTLARGACEQAPCIKGDLPTLHPVRIRSAFLEAFVKQFTPLLVNTQPTRGMASRGHRGYYLIARKPA